MSALDLLKGYRGKRDFSTTSEPEGGGESHGHSRSTDQPRTVLGFVVQKHAARNLHYDIRLELDGALKSWAVLKGPSLDPNVKRMGAQVEDHPLSYARFEGPIPRRQYGAGNVMVWDHGVWVPVGDPLAGLKAGKLKFELFGEKLKGGWTLVRTHGRMSDGAPHAAGDTKEPWLLIKVRDQHARKTDE